MSSKDKGFRGSASTPAITKFPRYGHGYLFAWFDHVHTPQNRCIKNRFGPKCMKPTPRKEE